MSDWGAGYFVDRWQHGGGWAICKGPFDTLDEARAAFDASVSHANTYARNQTFRLRAPDNLMFAEAHHGNVVRYDPPRRFQH